MKIVVNGEPVDVDPGTTVGALVDDFGRGRSGIAVAVNGDVVPRTAWDAHGLVDGCEVEVLTAAQGG